MATIGALHITLFVVWFTWTVVYCSCVLLALWFTWTVVYCSCVLLALWFTWTVVYCSCVLLALWFTLTVVYCSCVLLALWFTLTVVYCSCVLLALWFTWTVVYCSCVLLALWFTWTVVYCSCVLLATGKWSWCSNETSTLWRASIPWVCSLLVDGTRCTFNFCQFLLKLAHSLTAAYATAAHISPVPRPSTTEIFLNILTVTLLFLVFILFYIQVECLLSKLFFFAVNSRAYTTFFIRLVGCFCKEIASHVDVWYRLSCVVLLRNTYSLAEIVAFRKFFRRC